MFETHRLHGKSFAHRNGKRVHRQSDSKKKKFNERHKDTSVYSIKYMKKCGILQAENVNQVTDSINRSQHYGAGEKAGGMLRFHYEN